MRDLRGKVAVVTGAASGIGRALVHALAVQGCDIALVDVDGSGLAAVRAELQATGRRTSVHICDVADREAMEQLPAEVIAAHGHVDVLINNAGVSVAGDLRDQTIEDLQWVVGINFWGVVYGCKFFLPHLRQAEQAYIVNLSSVFGLFGVPGQSSYCATKFAVRGFSESIGVELADTHIRVMSVHPGGIRTNIVRSTRYASPQMASARERVMKYFETRAMPPEDCAQQIIGAMRAGRTRLLVTPEAYLADGLKRLFPALSQRWIRWGRDRLFR